MLFDFNLDEVFFDFKVSIPCSICFDPNNSLVTNISNLFLEPNNFPVIDIDEFYKSIELELESTINKLSKTHVLARLFVPHDSRFPFNPVEIKLINYSDKVSVQELKSIVDQQFNLSGYKELFLICRGCLGNIEKLT